MNRTLKTGLIISATVIGFAALVHSIARALWATGLGNDTRPSPIRSAVSGECTANGCTYYDGKGGIIADDGPRTFFNYATSWSEAVTSHVVIGLVILIIVGIIAAVITSDIEAKKERRARFDAAVRAEAERLNDYDTVVTCPDPNCSCTYHFDEKFEDESGHWIGATEAEQADRYAALVKAAR